MLAAAALLLQALQVGKMGLERIQSFVELGKKWWWLAAKPFLGAVWGLLSCKKQPWIWKLVYFCFFWAWLGLKKKPEERRRMQVIMKVEHKKKAPKKTAKRPGSILSFSKVKSSKILFFYIACLTECNVRLFVGKKWSWFCKKLCSSLVIYWSKRWLKPCLRL